MKTIVRGLSPIQWALWLSAGVWLLQLTGPSQVRGQWVTQTNTLNAGWNGVYLHVDPGNETVEKLVDTGGRIEQIWRWEAPEASLRSNTDQQIRDTVSYWSRWKRSESANTLSNLVGNSAYLVRVTGVGSLTWKVKGKPLPPQYSWSLRGLNFVGFPANPAAPKSLSAFFGSGGETLQNAEIYRYTGANATDPTDPVRVTDLAAVTVARGEAYWIRTTNYNRYFGPFELTLLSSTGLRFTENVTTYTFRLRNLATVPVTVTMRLAKSDPAPGANAAPDVPALVIRGPRDTNTLEYTYTPIAQGQEKTWDLAARDKAGSGVEIFMGANRKLIDATYQRGTSLAGILQFTDSLANTLVQVPVSVEVGANYGLWVGAAEITHVGEYLQTYAKERVPGPRTFAPPLTNLVGRMPAAFSIGTNNLIAVANTGENTVTVLTNAGFGRFRRIASTNLPVGTRPLAIAVTDVNGDGRPDIVTANAGDNQLSVLTNNAAGRFTNAAPIRVGVEPIALIAADLDGRAPDDFVVLDTQASSLTVLLNKPDGVIKNLLDVGPIDFVVAARLSTNSTSLDLALVQRASGTVSILTNDGNGSLALLNNYPAGASPARLVAADMNADGRTDLICASTEARTITVLTNSGSAFFAKASVFPIGASPVSIAVADMDGNRYPDVVTANGSAGTLTVMTNDGAGGLVLSRVVKVPGNPCAVTVLDILGTGGADVVALSERGNNAPGVLTVLLDQGEERPVVNASENDDEFGHYIVTAANTNLGVVARPFPLRLIIHEPEEGNAQLLQQVYIGLDNQSNMVLATSEKALDRRRLGSARRMTAVHLPWTAENRAWDLGGKLSSRAGLTATVTTGMDAHESNPFLHTYHPDHDNLNATFDRPPDDRLPESYTISREITFQPEPVADSFETLVGGDSLLAGYYTEVVSIGPTRQFTGAGTFLVRRVLAIPTLTSESQADSE
ncbi:MAG: FG-GAP repeat domain-containing protein [Verrucomicrobiia bacterium]